MAKATSDDPSAKTNAGNLGWFTVFRMVYPFENCAYQTEIGKVSKPVRTRFGYHLIKVNGVRKARGEIRVAHIMIMTPEGKPTQSRRTWEDSGSSMVGLLGLLPIQAVRLSEELSLWPKNLRQP